MSELRLVAADLWETSTPLQLGPLHIDHRMTVVRLASGVLWVHSPVAYTDQLRAALEAQGEVGYLVAPSIFHDLYWPEWFQAYPDACFCAAPGLDQVLTDLPFSVELGTDVHADWCDDFDQVLLAGMPKVNETIFLHRATGTAIAADLVFNYDNTYQLSFASQLILRMSGSYQRLAMSRLFRMCIKDRNATRGSIAQVLSWEFDRLLVGHGSVVDSNARSVLAEACHVLDR